MRRAVAVAVLSILLAACGSRPPAPDWQVDAHGALERYQQAWLAGSSRAAQVEFDRARRELSATGQAGLVARAELTRCALQVASLDFTACPGFEALRVDAPAAERAYADYLLGGRAAADLLPEQHRPVAAAADPARVAAAIEDPLARLVAAGVAVRGGRGSPELLQLAADTASAQGWRRPLLAWLGAQLKLAEQRGDGGQAERLRRRIRLAAGER